MATFLSIILLLTTLLQTHCAVTLWENKLESSNDRSGMGESGDISRLCPLLQNYCPGANSILTDCCVSVGAGGKLSIKNAVSTIGYHHITLNFGMNCDNIESGEVFKVYYSIKDSYQYWANFTEVASYTTESETWPSFELPETVNNDIGIRILWYLDGSGSNDQCHLNGASLEGILITESPTSTPTNSPTQPTSNPTYIPTLEPTLNPSKSPTGLTSNPTTSPTPAPTDNPTTSPTQPPTANPTPAPTYFPTPAPTINPTPAPTDQPTTPSSPPTSDPTSDPTTHPTKYPSTDPTIYPTEYPSKSPTTDPTYIPTINPTNIPTINPTEIPTIYPTHDPTSDPSMDPTSDPSMDPTKNPTLSPTYRSGQVGGETTIDLNDGGELEGNSSSSDRQLLIALICVAVLFSCCFIVFGVKYYKMKQEKAEIEKNNAGHSVELGRVASSSEFEGNPIGTISITGITPPLNPDDEPEEFSNEQNIKMWLSNIGLEEYYNLFIAQGFGTGSSALLEMTDVDLKDMGISKIGHRKLILKQIGENQQNIGMSVNGTVGENGEDMGENIVPDMHNNNDEDDELLYNINVDDKSQKIITTKGNDNDDIDMNDEIYKQSDDQYITTKGATQQDEDDNDDVLDDKEDSDNKMYQKPLNQTKNGDE